MAGQNGDIMLRPRELSDLSRERFPEWHAMSFNPPRASKRAIALNNAGARRELWRQHHEMPARELQEELALHEFHLSDYCRPYRTEHLRRVSLWYVRMIRSELRSRSEPARLTRQHAQSN
jgi:hypothetical protein